MGKLLQGIVGGVRGAAKGVKTAYNKLADPVKEANEECRVTETKQRDFLNSIDSEVKSEVNSRLSSICDELGINISDPQYKERVDRLRDTFTSTVKKSKLILHDYNQGIKHIEDNTRKNLSDSLVAFENKNAKDIENSQMRVIIKHLYKDAVNNNKS